MHAAGDTISHSLRCDIYHLIPFWFPSKVLQKKIFRSFVVTFLLYLPFLWVKVKTEGAASVHGPLCCPIYFVYIIVSFVLHSTAGAGFDDSSIDEHTIGIRDFSRSLPRSRRMFVFNQQTMWKVYLLKKNAERFFKHKFQNVDPFLSTFHLKGLSDKSASSSEQYITSCNIWQSLANYVVFQTNRWGIMIWYRALWVRITARLSGKKRDEHKMKKGTNS